RYLTSSDGPFVMFVFEEIGDRVLMRYIRGDIGYGRNVPSPSFMNNNVPPVLYSFAIVARDVDPRTVTVDISNLFVSTLPWVNVPSKFGVSTPDPARSGLVSIRASKNKLEFRQFLTYHTTLVPNNPTNLLTLEIEFAIISLPECPMMPRL